MHVFSSSVMDVDLRSFEVGLPLFKLPLLYLENLVLLVPIK